MGVPWHTVARKQNAAACRDLAPAFRLLRLADIENDVPRSPPLRVGCLKRNNMQKTYTILTVLVLVFSSACTPETIPPTLPHLVALQATPLSKPYSPQASTGEGNESDEEDPIIQGQVLAGDGSTVPNGQVTLIPNGSANPVATATTDSLGHFQFVEQPGTYYFQVTPAGQSTATSDTLTILSDVWVDLHLN